MAERKRFLLRLSPELWEELERMADAEFRSVNAQIQYLLRDAVTRRRRHALSLSPEESAAGAAEGAGQDAG